MVLVLLATLGAFVAMVRGVAADLSLGAAVAFLLALGVLTPQQALHGFASEQMHTVALLFVLAGGLRSAGSLQIVSSKLLVPTNNVLVAAVRLLVPVAALSGFLNNTPLVAMLIPEVRAFAQRTGIAASRLLIPLSYAAIVGGLITVIGTSTNLVVNGLVAQAGRPTVGFLEIGMVGLPVCITGVVYAVVAARWLLPDRPDVDANLADVRAFVTELVVDPDGPYAGRRLADIRVSDLPPLAPAEIVRADQVIPAPRPDHVVHGGDRLAFVGPVASILTLRAHPGFSLAPDPEFRTDDPRRSLVELLISVHCPLIGHRVGDGTFRKRYNAAVLAVTRHGERVPRDRLAEWTLQAGDMLLVEAGEGFVEQQRGNRDFYLVAPREAAPVPSRQRALFGLAVLACMVLVAAFGYLSMFKATLIALAVLALTRYLSAQAVQQSLELRVLLTISLSFALGSALESSGLAHAFAELVTGVGAGNALVALAVIHLATALLTELVTNNAAAALMVPLALAVSDRLGVSHLPFVVTVMVGASASFSTPIGYTTNLMVYAPGGYRFTDFLKVGVPMSLLVAVVNLTLCPLFFPF